MLTQPRTPHRCARSCGGRRTKMGGTPAATAPEGSGARRGNRGPAPARPPSSFTRRAPRQPSAPRGLLGTAGSGRTGRGRAGAHGCCSTAPAAGRRQGRWAGAGGLTEAVPHRASSPEGRGYRTLEDSVCRASGVCGTAGEPGRQLERVPAEQRPPRTTVPRRLQNSKF